MFQVLKEEFSLSRFALKCCKPESFCEAQWRCPKLVFLLYRVVMSAYSIFALIHMVMMSLTSEWTHNVMVFLTTWSYIVETLFFFLGAFLALLFFWRPSYFQHRAEASLVEVELRYMKTVTTNSAENFGFSHAGENDANGCFASSEDDHKPTSKEIFSADNPRPILNGDHVLSKNSGSNVNGELAVKGNSGSNINGELVSSEKGEPENTDAGSCRQSQSDLNPKRRFPWYVQLYWLLGNIIQTYAVIVTIIYFGALYPSLRKIYGDVSLQDVNVHAMNTAMLVLDVAVCARPVRLLHCLYSVLFGLTYVLFSVIYWAVDPENNVIYPNVLDWSQPGISVGVVLGLCLVGVPLLQLANFCLYRLRLHVYRKIYNQQYF